MRAYFIEVVLTKIDRNGILGYSELALFRHLFISHLRTHDADLVVLGGQHDFMTSWWQRATVGQVSPYAASAVPEGVNTASDVQLRTCVSGHRVTDDQQYCDECGIRL